MRVRYSSESALTVLCSSDEHRTLANSLGAVTSDTLLILCITGCVWQNLHVDSCPPQTPSCTLYASPSSWPTGAWCFALTSGRSPPSTLRRRWSVATEPSRRRPTSSESENQKKRRNGRAFSSTGLPTTHRRGGNSWGRVADEFGDGSYQRACSRPQKRRACSLKRATSLQLDRPPVNVIEHKTAPLPRASHFPLDPQTRTLTRRREHSIELEGLNWSFRPSLLTPARGDSTPAACILIQTSGRMITDVMVVLAKGLEQKRHASRASRLAAHERDIERESARARYSIANSICRRRVAFPNVVPHVASEM
jgi:hypothetical protein